MANIRSDVTRYETQNDLMIFGFLKFKLRKPKVLLSSFARNVAYYNNIVSLHILSYEKDRQVIEKCVSQVRGFFKIIVIGTILGLF